MNKIILLSLVILFLTASKGFSWENKITHPALSEDVAVRYFGPIAMGESVNGKPALEWVRDGARLEDEGSIPQFLAGTARSMNFIQENGVWKVQQF